MKDVEERVTEKTYSFFLILTTSDLNKMDHFLIFAFLNFEAKYVGKSVLLMNHNFFNSFIRYKNFVRVNIFGSD